MVNEDIKQIINDAVLAPSGENCQPWRFVARGNVIGIYNIPEADQSLYNFEQKGSYVAHGALLTNLEISAREHGLVPEIAVFPDEKEDNLVSRIRLEGGGTTRPETTSIRSSPSAALTAEIMMVLNLSR